MHVEREVKARVDCAMLPGIEDELRARGYQLEARRVERDTYYQHPCRDMLASDEALRLRLAGGGARLTYKGPRRGGGGVKERLELEAEMRGDIAGILERLGFKPVVTVVKERLYYRGRGHTVTLDRVEGLGCFVEVEGEDPLGVLGELGVPRENIVEETYAEMIARRLGLL